MKKFLIIQLALIFTVSFANPSQALPSKKFANCTALNKVYPHGVAKKGYQKNASGLTGRPKISNSIYNLNAGSDRDKDGVACEK